MPQQTSTQTLLTFPEVLAYLRISRSTLYRLMRDKQLSGHKVGATWRFYAGDVRACVERDEAPVMVTLNEQAFLAVIEQARIYDQQEEENNDRHIETRIRDNQQ